MTNSFRIERDSMGELQVPADALWGAQTQRAVQNFPISGIPLPRAFIGALALVKQAAARANTRLELLDAQIAQAIDAAAADVAAGRHDEHFPIDIFQTGSGTSTNMNANEVIASLATRRLGKPVHANDHVNMGQSSNDSIPTAIHVSAALSVKRDLVPALEHLRDVLRAKEREVGSIVKTGRTHLMDAMPVTLGQELSGWRTQIEHGIERLASVEPRLARARPGRHRRGHRHQCASAIRLAVQPGTVGSDRVVIQTRAQFFRGHVLAGHGGRAVGTTQGDRGQPDEDRQRSALDE